MGDVRWAVAYRIRYDIKRWNVIRIPEERIETYRARGWTVIGRDSEVAPEHDPFDHWLASQTIAPVHNRWAFFFPPLNPIRFRE